MKDLLPILLPILITAVGSLVGTILLYRSSRKDTDRQQGADIMAGYAALCDDLRAMMDVNNKEIGRLRQELCALQSELAKERAAREEERLAYQQERAALLERISELEKVNTRLQEKLDAFQPKCEV